MRADATADAARLRDTPRSERLPRFAHRAARRPRSVRSSSSRRRWFVHSDSILPLVRNRSGGFPPEHVLRPLLVTPRPPQLQVPPVARPRNQLRLQVNFRGIRLRACCCQHRRQVPPQHNSKRVAFGRQHHFFNHRPQRYRGSRAAVDDSGTLASGTGGLCGHPALWASPTTRVARRKSGPAHSAGRPPAAAARRAACAAHQVQAVGLG